jgi:7,8-dihydropterin-6-yl-methyl-4-(beta-D-ribofuranosyl)aminobenzene 5'-phosphate synthase
LCPKPNTCTDPVDPGEMTRVATVTVLMDNHALIDRYFLAEPALSILLEADGKKILFDTGYSGAFLSNADRMGVSLLDLTDVILSHGHSDHSGGLVHLARHLSEAILEGKSPRVPRVIAHPWAFYPRSKPPFPESGSILSLDRAKLHFPVEPSTVPTWITPDIVVLGEIPRRFAFERFSPGARRIEMPDGSVRPDDILDDTALVFRSPEGLILITGCSHAGICNTIEYARELCGEGRIRDIIGGFHLISPSRERLDNTMEYLHDVDAPVVHACHCTSLPSLVALSSRCRIAEVGVGLRLTYP